MLRADLSRSVDISKLPFAGPHTYPWTIDIDDTDLTGTVFHGNYVRAFSRARTAVIGAYALRTLGESDGLGFSVLRMSMRFRRPGRLGDELSVRTKVRLTTPHRLLFQQTATRGDVCLAEADTEVVCLSGDRPQRIPVEALTRPWSTCGVLLISLGLRIAVE